MSKYTEENKNLILGSMPWFGRKMEFRISNFYFGPPSYTFFLFLRVLFSLARCGNGANIYSMSDIQLCHRLLDMLGGMSSLFKSLFFFLYVCVYIFIFIYLRPKFYYILYLHSIVKLLTCLGHVISYQWKLISRC